MPGKVGGADWFRLIQMAGLGIQAGRKPYEISFAAWHGDCLTQCSMDAFSVTIAQLGDGLPVGVAAVPTQLSAVPDLLAGLGALLVATIGVLVVRYLKDLDDRPRTVAPAPRPHGDGLPTAA